MRDKLPIIIISTNIEPSEFILQIETIAKSSEQFSSKKYIDSNNNEDVIVLNLYPIFETSQEGLLGQLIVHPNLKSKIRADVRAQRWKTCPLSYDEYVNTAKQLFYPLIKQYRKIFDSKCSFNIQSKYAIQPKLPPRAEYFFNLFANSANTTCLHHLDWKRFYEFIYVSHAGRIKIPLDDLTRLLLSSGFCQKDAEYLTKIYNHGRKILQSKLALNYHDYWKT